MSQEFKYIEFKTEENIITITLNRPPLNVLNIEMLKEINKALKSALETESAGLLVINAKGKAFSAGLDIKDHKPDKIETLISLFFRTFILLNSFAIPTMSIIHGEGAFGGGCELAIFCDIVIASENAKFVQPEIKVGVIPPIASIIYPRIIGKSATLEMLLTGKEYKAPVAAKKGLITRAIADDKLEIETKKLIKKITSNSLIINKAIKQTVGRTFNLPLEEAIKEVQKIYTKSLIKTHDMREGLNAFLEKRKPEWKNK